MVGLTNSSPPNVPQQITRLRDASTLFCAAWSKDDIAQAQRASAEAMTAFDHICNAFLRAKDDAKSHGTYSGSALEIHMNKNLGLLVSPVTREEQQANVEGPQPLGNGRLPERAGPIQPAAFHVALNKIKHRVGQLSNFRIEAARHIMVVAGDFNQRPDYMFEFDVIEFCDQCNDGAALI